LPPTPEEVDAFVADSRPEAYEELVERLLDSRHYGEKQAIHWLDAARYADSDGYERDPQRPHAWRWRDWVIDALNDDVPFDRFTVEQIAGDLLPNASVEQRVATGFLRNGIKNREAGVKGEEKRFEEIIDRISTIGTVWLGLTVGCINTTRYRRRSSISSTRCSTTPWNATSKRPRPDSSVPTCAPTRTTAPSARKSSKKMASPRCRPSGSARSSRRWTSPASTPIGIFIRPSGARRTTAPIGRCGRAPKN
jgi:hypothetical protein